MRPDSAPTLAYAPLTKWRPRRRTRRIISGTILAIGIAFGWYWRVDIQNRATLFYWTRECRNYKAPADQIVLYIGPRELASRLLASDPAYRLEGGYLRRLLHSWNRLERLADGPGQGDLFGGPPIGTPPPSERLIQKLPELEEGRIIAFLHQRVSPSGNRRLVVVELQPLSYNGNWCEIIGQSRAVTMFHGVGRAVYTHELNLRHDSEDTESVPGHEFNPFCFFAGQPSASDPSRFTIAYEFDGQPGTIDGQLLDDDRVHLTVRDGPATSPWVQHAKRSVIRSDEFGKPPQE